MNHWLLHYTCFNVLIDVEQIISVCDRASKCRVLHPASSGSRMGLKRSSISRGSEGRPLHIWCAVRSGAWVVVVFSPCWRRGRDRSRLPFAITALDIICVSLCAVRADVWGCCSPLVSINLTKQHRENLFIWIVHIYCLIIDAFKLVFSFKLLSILSF